MLDWIHEDCKHWGWQMRTLYLGTDGWPSRSMLGKLIDETVLGASAQRFMQHFPECLDGEAVKTNNAIKTLNERDREILFVDYVVIGKSKTKAPRMGISRRTYFDRRDAAHARLASAYHTAEELHRKAGKSAALNTGISTSHNSLALVL